MKAISDLLIAAIDLVEAEAKSLRRGLLKATVAMGLAVAAAIVILGAVVLLLYGLYLALLPGAGPTGAAMITGVIGLALAGGLIGGAVWISR